MQTLSDIRALLDAHGLRPKHRFGQNFLHDQNLINRLVDAAEISPGETVLEVGPGTGALTEALLEREVRVVACEIDHDLAELLRLRLGESVTLIEADILDGKHRINSRVLEALGGKPFKLIANLPYNAASPLMINLLLSVPWCNSMCVTIQKEVADRLLAQRSTKEYGPLSIVARTFAQVERLTNVAPSCFWPQPEVTSAMVRLVRRAENEIDIDDPPAFGRFVTMLFTKRRKQLGTIFGRDAALPEPLDPMQRPEALSVEDAVALWRSLGRA